VAARAKAWVCGSSLAEILGSNPTGSVDVIFVLSVVCCQVEVYCDEPITLPEESYLL